MSSCGMKCLSQHAEFLLLTGGVCSQTERIPAQPGTQRGSCCLCFWMLFSQALSMGMSLAVLSSCSSPGWCCCEVNSEFPPCSTLEKSLLLIHKLNKPALEHGANNLGLFPHMCQWLYQKDMLTLVQQVLDIAHRAVCAQTHVLDVGLPCVCGPECCGWGGAGPSPHRCVLTRPRGSWAGSHRRVPACAAIPHLRSLGTALHELELVLPAQSPQD